MGNITFTCCIVLTLLANVSFGARRQGKPFCTGFVKVNEERGDLSHRGEVELSRQKLHLLLRGLVTLLVNLFPDCLPKKEQKQDEGIKVFRQIIACPPFPLHQPVCIRSDQTMEPQPNQFVFSGNECIQC